MKRYLFVLCALALLPASLSGAPMKARVLQQYYAQDRAGLERSFQWTLDALEQCGPDLDIIVLPEAAEVPGKTFSKEEYLATAHDNGLILQEACARTARRCSSYVFAGMVDFPDSTGRIPGPRNAIYCYGRDGKLLAKYHKEHLTRNEWKKLDKSYTEQWTQPYILEVEGLRLAFLVCYDFYFYENFANIARWKPDIIIGCSHQRSDTFRALELINCFCAYNTGAYLVRSSVSMGADCPLAGCSCVASPTGELLGALHSEENTTLDVVFDPKKKYLKPAGYSNPPALHCEYIELGRRPWKYRPGGGAIVPSLEEAHAPRLAAIPSGRLARRHPMAALGALAAEGAGEIRLRILPDADSALLCQPVPGGAAVPLEQVLQRLSCHSLMDLRLEGASWDEAHVGRLLRLVMIYDCEKYVTLSSGDTGLLRLLKESGTRLPRCLVNPKAEDLAAAAAESGCTRIDLDRRTLRNTPQERLQAARDAGLRITASGICRPARIRALMDAGFEAVFTPRFLRVAI